MKKMIGILIVSAAMAACGKPKLTEEQKAIVAETMTSTGRAQNSAKVGNDLPDPAPANKLAAPVANPGTGLDAQSNAMISNVIAEFGLKDAATSDPAPKAPANSDEVQVKMGTALKDKYKDKSCTFENPTNKSSSSMSTSMDGSAPSTSTSQNFSIKMKLSGDNCPASMDMAIDLNMGESSLDGTISMHYSVKDEEFRKLNDVDAINLDGKMSGKGGSDNAEMSISMKGNINSQKNGKIDLNMNGKMSASKSSSDGEFTMSYKYAKFEAEFKIKTNNKKMEYYVNGEKVTKEEFEKLVKSGGMAGGGMMNGVASGGGVSDKELSGSDSSSQSSVSL